MNLESECCGAPPWLDNPDLNRCSNCKEWCEFTDTSEQEEDYSHSSLPFLNVSPNCRDEIAYLEYGKDFLSLSEDEKAEVDSIYDDLF